jgi:RNA polymerase sigma-70 factor (ECF subfamily)
VNTLNDKRLIHAAQKGSLEAFQQLVHGFDQPVLHFALRVTGTEQVARSIYWNAISGVYAGLAGFQCECALSLCAFRIVANLCLDYLRGDRGRAVSERPGGKLGSILGTLSPRERIVFELRHYQGLELRTVSKLLDMTEEAARNILVRAGHKLRAALVEM